MGGTTGYEVSSGTVLWEGEHFLSLFSRH